jgi:hypothetical protein
MTILRLTVHLHPIYTQSTEIHKSRIIVTGVDMHQHIEDTHVRILCRLKKQLHP